MLGHVTTITHKNDLVLSHIDPGEGRGEGQVPKKVKSGNLPNIFDDDCVRMDNCLNACKTGGF